MCVRKGGEDTIILGPRNSTKLILSEKWQVTSGFEDDYYLLSGIDGKWREITRLQANALALLDGRRSLKEVVAAVSPGIERGLMQKKRSDDLRSFLKGCYKLKVLKKVSLL